jgi:hypothetical protein
MNDDGVVPADGMIAAAKKGASARPVGNSITMVPQPCIDVGRGKRQSNGGTKALSFSA